MKNISCHTTRVLIRPEHAEANVINMYRSCLKMWMDGGWTTNAAYTISSPRAEHYVNVSVLIKFSQKTSVFTLIIISSP